MCQTMYWCLDNIKLEQNFLLPALEINYGKRFNSFLTWCRLTSWLPYFLRRYGNGYKATVEKIRCGSQRLIVSSYLVWDLKPKANSKTDKTLESKLL